VNVKHLGGIYVPLWTFVGDLGGFCDAGVDKNAKCWYIAGKDNKVQAHLIDHKYQSSQTLKRHKYQVLFSIKLLIASH
jgi:hypothetical protein